MTRPLLDKTIVELGAMADRNRTNRAELDLIRAELRHRSTPKAQLLAKRMAALIAAAAAEPKVADPGKYAAVHEAATKAGSPVLLGWKHASANFTAGNSQHDETSVYGTIHALCRDAGAKGLPAADLVTALRHRQIGNTRSQYCEGLPPIGWAEGWIDTAVTRGVVLTSSRSSASSEEPAPKLHLQPDPTSGRPRIVAPSPAPLRKPKPMTEARRWTEEVVASLRTKLIDLGKKSPLISFKHGGRSASILRIVDERPDLLCAAIGKGAVGFEPLPAEDETPKDELTPAFKIAYERARLTNETFLAATDKLGDDERDAKAWQQAERALRAEVRHQLGLPTLDYGKTLDVAAIARAHGFDPSFDLKSSDDEPLAAHHEDDKLRVLLTAKELDKRLKTIAERYGSHKRETGLHTLFMVMGFVQWFDDDDSDVALHAPLLLRDVELVRKAVAGRYVSTLTPGEDGLQVNVALAEKMRQHWGLELPPLRPEETPESYFIRVEAVLAKSRRLSLRRFATLAVLPFPRMVLWKDLDPAAWPEAAFAEHRLLPGLLGAVQVAGKATLGDTIDVDAPEWAKRAPALIRPADASQHSALIDVGEGHDLAIEGPPGTGKSETITNMIATALAAGKKVLFVAEKQAALRVVADRLRASGFGPMLLELHGDNAHRADVYDGLRERLKTRVVLDPAVLASHRLQLDQQRSLLRRYMSLIDQPLGALGRTAYWLAWREVRLRDAFDPSVVEAAAVQWQPTDATTVDRAILAERRDRLDTFGAALAAVNDAIQAGERTRWVEARKLDPFDQRRQLQAAAGASIAAVAMARAGSALQGVGDLIAPGPAGPIDAVDTQLSALLPFDPVDEQVARATLRHPDTARALLRQQARWRQLCGKLADDVANPASVSSPAIDGLATAIDGIRPSPLSVAIATERLEATTSAAASAEATAGERRLLADQLALDPALTIQAMRTALNAIDALGREPATVAALYRSELLDPLAEAALHSERLRAATLREERQALAGETTDEAAETEPGEMTRLADILADSGAFARLFGGAFKGARRHAGRLVREPADRLATAELLRRLARHRNQASTFQRESVVAGWFPALLWKGADSDWDAIQRARAVLIDARRQLVEAGADTVLPRWLALSADERVRVGAAVGRVLPMLDKIPFAELASCPVAKVSEELTSRRNGLAALSEALLGVGALPDGLIVREGEDLADRLEVLEAAADEFAALAAQEGFGWVGDISAPLEPLARALAHSDVLRELEGPLPIVAALISSDAPAAMLERVIGAGTDWRKAAAAWRAADRRLEDTIGLQASALSHDWEVLSHGLAAMAADEAGARLTADLLRYSRALDEANLTGLRRAALGGVIPADRLADIYELLLVRTLLQGYLGGDGAELGRTGGLTLARARQSFNRLDKELHELEAKAIVAKRLGDKPPLGVGSGLKSQYTEMELLDSELGLRRPRTPLRDVVHRAGAALQMLKPVWMMSPTSAAQYIRPATLAFDLLVVDEASQMRPEFSISSVLRGDQFVVVGDANQLPPSDHFQTGGSDDGSEEDVVGVTQDTESILDLANQRFRRKRRLKWHYRSQHESLIQFSNREFYESDLVVFPSPMGDDDELLGVKCRYVDGAVYEASINQREAEAVIEEAFRLMRAYPQHSLGIAAMNAKQTELIQNEFDRLILEQPEIRRYVDEYAGGVEEFFIKNLENVQGDERDIILISTVYGPNKDGKVLQNFGLMNREVGWRRLNVLVTRAKLSTRLFTSLRPDDVKVTPTSSRGVRAFKAYLTYAHGGASYQDASGGEPDSDFELFVADALRGAGYEVVHQVGVEGFRIDLGVRHPDYPIGFIAGVECDGASFHRGLTVRDRDRIRQSVLEGMGWKIYRIWSTDWFADPSRELSRLLAFLEDQRAAFAAEHDKRLKPSSDPAPVPAPSRPHSQDSLMAPDEPSLAQLSATVRHDEPRGRAMRPLGEIAWYETVKGQSYKVWLGGRSAGDVEVLSRATAAPRLYGNQMIVARSEYEGRVEATGERFLSHDIHAAVREVARRAEQVSDKVS